MSSLRTSVFFGAANAAMNIATPAACASPSTTRRKSRLALPAGGGEQREGAHHRDQAHPRAGEGGDGGGDPVEDAERHRAADDEAGAGLDREVVAWGDGLLLVELGDDERTALGARHRIVVPLRRA